MTASAVATKSTDNKSAQEPGPDDCPDIYASLCKGDCLQPVFSDGTCLVFSKLEPPEAGDFVGLWLHPDALAPGEMSRRVKRLYMGLMPGLSLPFSLRPGDEVEAMIVLEQLNPPRLFHVRASHVLALHKVIGIAATNGDGTATMLELPQEALS